MATPQPHTRPAIDFSRTDTRNGWDPTIRCARLDQHKGHNHDNHPRQKSSERTVHQGAPKGRLRAGHHMGKGDAMEHRWSPPEPYITNTPKESGARSHVLRIPSVMMCHMKDHCLGKPRPEHQPETLLAVRLHVLAYQLIDARLVPRPLRLEPGQHNGIQPQSDLLLWLDRLQTPRVGPYSRTIFNTCIGAGMAGAKGGVSNRQSLEYTAGVRR